MTPKRTHETATKLIDALDRVSPDFAEQLKNAVAAGFDPYQPIKGNFLCVKPPSVYGDFVLRIHDAPLITNILHASADVDAFGKPLQSFKDILLALPGGLTRTPAVGTMVGDPASGEVPAQFLQPRTLNLLDALPYLDTGTLQRDAKFDALLALLDTKAPTVQAELAEAIPAYFKLMEGNGWTFESGALCMARMINAGADLYLLAEQGQRLEFNGTSLLIWLAATHDPDYKYDKHADRIHIMEETVVRLLALEPSARDKLFDIQMTDRGFGDSALMNAVEVSSPKMVGLLLDAGADMMKKHKTKRRNKVRVSPYTLAQHLKRHDVVQLMEATLAQRAIQQTLLAASIPLDARPSP